MKVTFQMRLFISLVLIFTMIFSLLTIYYYIEASDKVYQEMSRRARVQSEIISIIPGLRLAVIRDDIKEINTLMREVVSRSDSAFVVIGDKNANHLFHSTDDNKIGTPLIGNDNTEVLSGKTVTTLRWGGMGISLRSKSPIYDANNNVIGIVSVGYMKNDLDQLTFWNSLRSLALFLLLLVGLFLFSWFFTRGIKKQIFSLEPREIGLLVRQQQAMLESVYEGVIVIDNKFNIMLMNKAAQLLLGIRGSVENIQQQSLNQLISPVPFFEPSVMLTQDTHDEISCFNQRTVIASRIRIRLEEVLQGWVITFRDRQEIDSLMARLSQVKCYLNNLRIMHHEQLNNITVISGLLQSGRYQDAIGYIQKQSEYSQCILDFISSQFTSPTVCGLLLGKLSLARDKGVELIFDPASQLIGDFNAVPECELISIIGNLLDNAIEASCHSDYPRQPVEVLILGDEHELIIEVADKGCGIPEDIREIIFERGVTSKPGDDHGIGLSLVHSFVMRAGGYVEVTANQPYGSVFSVFIPEITISDSTGR